MSMIGYRIGRRIGWAIGTAAAAVIYAAALVCPPFRRRIVRWLETDDR